MGSGFDQRGKVLKQNLTSCGNQFLAYKLSTKKKQQDKKNPAGKDIMPLFILFHSCFANNSRQYNLQLLEISALV